MNTYYPITGNVTLNAGAQSIYLAGVPATDQYSNNFGTTPISAGDLILIIQMQDASINYTNTSSYGSGTTNSGPDNLGGTGFTALGNTGVFEYVIATNNVPLTGGNLTFKGTGANNGVLNSFYNADPTTSRGKKTFQVVRVPQYSNLTLTANITTPPFNGVAGGIIAFNVSGTFNFNGFSIDGSARGFRGGYSPKAGSDANDSKTYVGDSSNSKISGKGEGIAGTPKYMWDGFNQVANTVEGMPGGSSGRGAPANAGGGGNDHNTGGGGGGNGGFGGLGGAGWQGGGGDLFSNNLTGAGRPGSKSYTVIEKFPRLIMGGGGGAGDANDASSGVKGGVGGAIILINAGNVLGNGTIYANGGKGAPGTYANSPDGAGGGGAGGTVLLNVSNNSTATIQIQAKGGVGGNTENDNNNEHGPGGGGGGGIICHNVSSSVTITTNVTGGAAGKSNAGNGINHGAIAGTDGYVSTFTVADVPANLQVNANCFPVLETKAKTLSTTAICNAIDEKVSYEIEIKNTGAGNAAGVMLDFSFPTGIEFDSATATYSTGASGPAGTLANSATATANNPVFGGFNIAQNGIVTITLVGKVAASIAAGTYSANAQALYLDPTRTTANSTRRITAFTNAYGTANKTYEGTGQSNVPGINFNGTGTVVDDISILALPAAPTVSVTQTTCTAPTGTITVNTPANGSGISYTLTGTNPVSASVNSTTGIFSGLVPGTYSVTTTNAQGCTSAANTGIVINAVAGAPTTTGVTICQDGTGSLTATSPCGTSNSSGAKIARAGNSVGTASLSWSNPSRVNSNDSSYASATVSSGGNITVVTRSLQGTDFDFNIPSNATITGIQVTIGRYSSTASSTVNVKDNVVSLIKAGTVIGENKSITGSNWPISSTSAANYGGSSDLWNTTWTPADINNANFGIALSASITRTSNNDITAYVDYMQITVNYTIGGIEWYTTSTGGSSIYTGTSFNPVGVTGSGLANTATATTKTYYAACSGNSNCRAAVNFVVNAKPTIATITSNSRCGAGEVTLEATASAGTINWYAAATGGTSLGTGESFTTPSLSTSTSYYVDATENGCTTPTRTEVKATINAVPTINSTTEGSICGSGSVRLTATASTGATINWYADPTSATVLGTGTTFDTPTLTATTTYYVGAVTASGCTSTSRIAVAAVINTASSIIFTSGTQNPTVCSGGSVPNAVYTFGGSATNATVSNLPTGLSATVDTNAKTVTISGNPTAAGTYTITTVGHTAPCVEVTIQGKISLTPNVTIASFSPATSSRCQAVETITRTTTATNSTGGITYSLDSASSTGGNTINSTTGAVTYVAGWSGVTTITASAAGCNGPVTTTHTVTTNALPTATISGNLTACLTTTLTANSNATSATYVWYKNNAVISNQTSSTLVVNSDGDYKVKIRNSSTGCEATSAASTVKISDTEKPVKPVLADITAECSVTVTAPTTTDNCKGTVTGTTTDPLTYNAQGTYTINWSFSDGNGNVETATQKVIVKDTQKPVKPTLADITGECSATATAPTTTDNCKGTVTGTTTDPLTYSAQGTYTINWSFSDGNGNTETATQKVIIKDTQKPVKPTLADITGECSATATAPTTTDNCKGTVTGITTDPLTYNAQGTYTINWSFSDGNGNVETATQKVIIKDTQKPVKPTLADITGECSATATAPTTTDNCKGTVTGTTTDPLTYNAQGTYTINWSFSDGNGNTETATQKLIVKDTQKPVKPTLADITGECSATATAPTTTDNCAGTVTGTTTDPLTYNAQGTYTINWSFSDGNGNVETATQKVIVKDTQKPSITCPLAVSVSTDTNSCTATGVALGAPTVSDNCSATVTVTNDAPSSFPIGNTTVTWTATDAGGNTETCTQIVKVIGEIIANNDSVSSSDGVTGGIVITNVFDNDVLNCNKVNREDVDVIVKGTVPSVLIFNTANGAVSVKPNTPTGTYTFDYSICEIANSGNCKTATVEVEIVNDLIAVKDDFGTKTSGSASAIVGNVKSNDTLDGASVTSTNTVVTIDSDGPLSVDANGDVTLEANTPSGTYSITYEICEKNANPSNCKTATAEVKVENGLIAVKDDFGTKASGSASAVIGNVKTNDTLDGAFVTSTNTVVTIDSDGPLSVDADGDVTLAANTPSGSYSITYEICEKDANPSNCKTATAEVKVVNGLVAVKDDFGTKTSGSASAIVGNVKSNDTLDGASVTSTNTVVTIDSDGPLSVDADGDVTLAANTPSGSYSITYEICEKGANPSNCKTAVAEVKVANTIEAVLDTITPINGNIGGTTISLAGNDTLNGNKVVIGTNSGEVTISIVRTLPSGLTLNTNGTITVASGTPKGDYKVEYTICEVGAVPANCDSVTITVPVTAGNLVANADEIPSVLGSNVPQTLGKNVFDNDTKNAQPLDPADVTLKTTAADPKGYLTLDADGKIILGANPPAGDYELTYEICEKLNLDNCSSNTVKVTVGLPVIDAVEDVIASINGNIGGKTISLTANDKLNGNPITVGTAAGEVKFEIIGTLPSGLTLNSDYTISVAPNTPKGDYKVEYKICENTNPTNCDSVIITVPVTGGNLVANADEIPSVLGSDAPQTLGKNVFDNDTKNGQPLDPSDVTLKTTAADPKGYLTVDADGKIILGANPPAGDYELTYEICEKLNPDNCSSNTVKITVGLPVIDAVEDTVSPINGNIGGKTISLTANDKLNGNPITVGTAAGEVKFEIIGTLPSGLTLNSDYTISVAPNTPKGDYKVEYKICENTNPLNCDSVTITVPVTVGNLVANADEIPSVLGSDAPQTLGKNVFDNDTKNGQPLDPSDVTLKTTSADPKGYLTVDADGKIILGANPPAGDYEMTYEICEKLNPDNCSSNTVKVTVVLPVIDAVEDVIASINGNIGGKTIALTANDKLNGSPITVGTAAGEVKFEIIGTLPSGLTLNSDYTISIAPNTPKGDYKVEYKICENTNPTNCDSVIVTVPVTGGNLVANEDLMSSAVGVNIPQKLINVFENDTKDGNKLVPSEVDLKVTQEDPKGYLTVDADGNVVLAPNAPAGEYELTYTICEKLNPNNCDSNVVKVTVTEPKMAVTANSYCLNNVPYVNYSVSPENFTTNNLLTVKWIDSNNNVVATQTNLPLSGNILWPGAEIDSNKNGTDWPGWILNNGIWSEGADGFEATRNGVKIEFSLNPTVTVSVAYPPATPDCNARPTFSIKANNDETGPVNVKKGANATVNIFENDLLNGAQIKPSDVILSIPAVNPNFSLNANGSVNIAANTPDGIYELTYQICEAANTSNCSQAVIKITVDNVADPAPPTENQITLNNDNDVSADGINGSLEFVNVLENDLINGQPINPADVIIKPLTESPYFEWNADGTVNVKPNTPGGNYPLTYQVCEKANSSNCSTATLNVFVEVPAISVIKTAVFNDENKSGFANAGETITYKFTVTNTGNVPLVGITINDPLPGVVVSGPAINLGVNESNETNFTAVYKITQEDINRGSVSNQATVKGSSLRGVVVEDQSDDASNSGDSPTVLDLNGCSIKVMNAFSPNGDSKNARFYIRGIECYPDNTVEIYNRWGVLVFSIDQYNNNDRVFEGYSNGRSTIKQTDGLPVGTYFYILKYKDSAQKSHQESGYLYLNK
ncbi:gliding motility-associated C-terminal domain-containing protein [Flavobacterium chungangensis]|uniref:Gliding motility-associated C-terminal domain-containing protein n=2 Tax=Flavobacterium TaxID=237 RepID=A0ABV8ZCP2_9FLAO